MTDAQERVDQALLKALESGPRWKWIVGVTGVVLAMLLSAMLTMGIKDHDQLNEQKTRIEVHEHKDMHEGARSTFLEVKESLDKIHLSTKDTSLRVRSIETEQIKQSSKLDRLDEEVKELKEEVRKRP